MELIGRVKLINPTQQISQSFSKREVVLTTDEQYPQHILVEFTQDRCAALDNYQVGQQVKVGINIRGREWTNPQGETKYFNSIQGWRIENFTPPNGYQPAPVENQGSAVDNYMPNKAQQEDEHDDLPF